MKDELPLIRLSAINPFLLELRRRGLETGSLLQDLELPTAVPASHELFVAAATIYELVERCGDLANDPYLGFSIGSALDLQGWEPISVAASKANTVGELLTLFAVQAAEHSSATTFYLRTRGERSTFGFERATKPARPPAQNDAFYMGFMSRLLRQATRDHWDPAGVFFQVADPACIPLSDEQFRVARGDDAGVQISFPTRWLFEPFQTSHFGTSAHPAPSGSVPRSLLKSIRVALLPHLHDPDLTVEKASRICGYERRRLARVLRDQGTSISRQIAALRAEKAGRDLAGTDHRIAAIAESVGFTDPTVFSRAFKKWTGLSPQEYRRTHRSQKQEKEGRVSN
jgi:AraC-like DNA-binding protein